MLTSSILRETIVFSYKSFGDLMISVSCARRCKDSHDIKYVLGEHLQDLASELNCGSEVVAYLSTGGGIPAAFNIRKKGLIRGFLSLLRLRKQLDSLVVNQQGVRLVESPGMRERYIFKNITPLYLKREANIYLSYERYFGTAVSCSYLKMHPRGKILLCPHSRVPGKSLPPRLIHSIIKVNQDFGMSTTVILNGQPVDRYLSDFQDVQFCKVERFGELRQLILESHCTVSADSFPGHFSEYLGRRTFVVKPSENLYWLPRWSYYNDSWMIFSDDLAYYRNWLQAELES